MHAAPVFMHIPDGFLSLPVSILCWLFAIPMISLAIHRTRSLGEHQIPLMGIMSAFIFAAQMINFPVAGGTSGHLIGGTLSAILLGPWAGMLVLTAVIIVQGLLFQDGGLLVMGANILNMGVLSVIVGYGLYRMIQGSNRGVRLVVIGVAAWLSVMTGALATSLELWLSGTARLDLVMPAMLGIHALIGFGEALITVAALVLIFQTRPDLLEGQNIRATGGRGWIAAGLLVALVVVVLSPLASANPDGLERVAIDMGFFEQGLNAPYAILPDYTLPALGETPLSTILAGALGLLVVTGIVVLIAHFIRKPTK